MLSAPSTIRPGADSLSPIQRRSAPAAELTTKPAIAEARMRMPMVASTSRSLAFVITKLPLAGGWPNIERMPSRIASSQPRPVSSRPTMPMMPVMVSALPEVRV